MLVDVWVALFAQYPVFLQSLTRSIDLVGERDQHSKLHFLLVPRNRQQSPACQLPLVHLQNTKAKQKHSALVTHTAY